MDKKRLPKAMKSGNLYTVRSMLMCRWQSLLRGTRDVAITLFTSCLTLFSNVAERAGDKLPARVQLEEDG